MKVLVPSIATAWSWLGLSPNKERTVGSGEILSSVGTRHVWVRDHQRDVSFIRTEPPVVHHLVACWAGV